MISREQRQIRHRVRTDIKAELKRLGLILVDCTMPAAIDYVCMVNDCEFNGNYEYTGEDWVRDTMFNYPSTFGY
jgi:hypothetical protein